jgi:hypothetical protein
MSPKKKAVGIRGSWFADVDGERLPCVHKHWWRNGVYHDPNAVPGEKKWDDFILAIQQRKRVILTDDEPWTGGAFVRKGYIAIWDVDNVRIEGSDLTFKFTNRVIDLV